MLNIGIIGCGKIARLMHLPHLQELHSYFKLVAAYDMNPAALALVKAQYPQITLCNDLSSFLRQPLDAVLVLTANAHIDEILAVAQAGKAMFIEKPICFTMTQAQTILQTLRENFTPVMVGYMKRFDPGVLRCAQIVKRLQNLRFVQINLWIPIEDRYIALDNPAPALSSDIPAPLNLFEQYAISDPALVNLSEKQRNAYFLLTTSGIHDVNLLRFFLGEPKQILSTQLWYSGWAGSTQMIFEKDLMVIYNWFFVQQGSYHERFDFIADTSRISLQFPSPYLRTTPVTLEEQNTGENNELLESQITVSHETSFKREIKHFYDIVVHSVPPITNHEDAVADLILIDRLVRKATD
jgi:predicted dehydrogenase